MILGAATPVRPLARVSRWAWVLLGMGLLAQVALHVQRPGSEVRYRALGAPPSVSMLRTLALGESALASRLLSLWLQAHDTQPGISVPLGALDYARVTEWLARALDLDPTSQYPLLSAARIYAIVPDPVRQRVMLEFIHRRFLQAPDTRWRWMAEAAIIAKHRLHDLPLALRYARALGQRGSAAPAWAREMALAVLEDMGELEAARVLVGGLLHDGRLRDPHEIRFLERRLRELEEKQAAKAAASP